ncbi:thiol:disulfide oxidoreductase [Aureimonas endophytica]|uniref:Thiol:disulfide oxidoreductase n=1 Tax=Aureimonas endophytica TaxID=2027858 RepID=A0A916ZFR4_9HYPH|nr:glutathione S-transferase N-terminal domain-containing protein [Aureimonas endophytica]GGD94459.1 thiol:disulfide oxidoreductase [Aureimonas endophytica]
MIELYTWTTPNGEKPVIMLEELGLDYEMALIDISTGVQKQAAFLELNPNGRIPAISDDGQRIFESGAILVHLAEKTGRFLAKSGSDRAEALSWTFFQVGGTGPMVGQLHHFRNAPEKIPYALKRYEDESRRLLGVLESRLQRNEWLAGDYSIADIMNWSWARSGLEAVEGWETFPMLAGWVKRIGARPAVIRALDKLQAAKAEL